MELRVSLLPLAVLATLGLVPACSDKPAESFDDQLADLIDSDKSAESVGWKKTSQAELDQTPDEVVPDKSDGSLPGSADWTSYVPPPGDQGEQGSCASWAAAYTIASSVTNDRLGWGLKSTAHIASPRSLYAEILDAAQSTDCEKGADGKEALEPLVTTGAASIKQVPYSDKSCVMNSQPSGRETFRIGGYADINPPDNPLLIKTEVAGGAIVLWGANIYDDFQDFKGSEVYTGSGTFLKDGEQHAGHMMAIVGYDDARQAFRVMNSWGRDWGDGGFAWVAYDTFVAMSTKGEDGEYRGEAWVAKAYEGDGAANALTMTPAADLTAAEQLVDGRGDVVLAFDYHFAVPLRLERLTVVDPAGHAASQTFGVSASDGRLHFKRRDGFQWSAGRYQATLEARMADGTLLPIHAALQVAPLGARRHAGARELPARGFVAGVLGASGRPARLEESD